MSDCIYIRAATKRNSLTTVLLAGTIMLVGIGWLHWSNISPDLVGYFIVLTGLVGFFLGWAKHRQPEFSLCIHRDYLLYQHRFGCWKLDWHNIQRVDQPRQHDGLQHHDIDMLALRLRQPELVLTNMSLRLASNLMVQQRHLLLLGDHPQCHNGQCYADNLIEDDLYYPANGKPLTGIRAMFAHRMARLRNNLGYDLYIEGSELDRPIKQVAQLLRECIHSSAR